MSNSKSKSTEQRPLEVLKVVHVPMASFRPSVRGIELRVQDKEVPTGVSMTVPDQGVKLADLLARFVATGDARIEGVGRDGFYPDNPDLDDDDLEKVSRSDIHEQTELFEQRKSEASSAQARLKAEKEDNEAKAKAEQERREASAKVPAEATAK